MGTLTGRKEKGRGREREGQKKEERGQVRGKERVCG